MSREVQTLLDFFLDEAAQSYFCPKCGDFHKAGECVQENQEKEAEDEWSKTT